jgi:hypothetical protein
VRFPNGIGTVPYFQELKFYHFSKLTTKKEKVLESEGESGA